MSILNKRDTHETVIKAAVTFVGTVLVYVAGEKAIETFLGPKPAEKASKPRKRRNRK